MADCPNCAALRSQVAQLAALVEQLGQRIAHLQAVLGALYGGVCAIRALIAAEREKPTMPLRRLVRTVDQRLYELIEMVRRS